MDPIIQRLKEAQTVAVEGVVNLNLSGGQLVHGKVTAVDEAAGTVLLTNRGTIAGEQKEVFVLIREIIAIGTTVQKS
jgi:hypothetical protein